MIVIQVAILPLKTVGIRLRAKNAWFNADVLSDDLLDANRIWLCATPAKSPVTSPLSDAADMLASGWYRKMIMQAATRPKTSRVAKAIKSTRSWRLNKQANIAVKTKGHKDLSNGSEVKNQKNTCYCSRTYCGKNRSQSLIVDLRKKFEKKPIFCHGVNDTR